MLAAVRSDAGKVREINEDYTCLEQFSNGLILAIVADGMGGHNAGEVASKTAVEIVSEELRSIITEDLTKVEYKEALELAIYKANRDVYEQSQNNDSYKGMGTTIIASIISKDWILLGHIGDSRAYLIREDMNQMTIDHSLVNELVKNGQISKEEANLHPQRNVLTRALGTEEEAKMDTIMIHWDSGNKLLLCSDGLTNEIEDQTILEVVRGDSTIEETADHLLKLANESGGNDNISFIIVNNE